MRRNGDWRSILGGGGGGGGRRFSSILFIVISLPLASASKGDDACGVLDEHSLDAAFEDDQSAIERFDVRHAVVVSVDKEGLEPWVYSKSCSLLLVCK